LIEEVFQYFAHRIEKRNRSMIHQIFYLLPGFGSIMIIGSFHGLGKYSNLVQAALNIWQR